MLHSLNTKTRSFACGDREHVCDDESVVGNIFVQNLITEFKSLSFPAARTSRLSCFGFVLALPFGVLAHTEMVGLAWQPFDVNFGNQCTQKYLKNTFDAKKYIFQ